MNNSVNLDQVCFVTSQPKTDKCNLSSTVNHEHNFLFPQALWLIWSALGPRTVLQAALPAPWIPQITHSPRRMSLKEWLWTLVPTLPPPPPLPQVVGGILGWLSTRVPWVPAAAPIIRTQTAQTAGKSLLHRALKLSVRLWRPAAAVLYRDIYIFLLTTPGETGGRNFPKDDITQRPSPNIYVLPSVLRAFVRQLHLQKAFQAIVIVIAKPSNAGTSNGSTYLSTTTTTVPNNTELIQTTCLKNPWSKSNICPDKHLYKSFNLSLCTCFAAILYLTNFFRHALPTRF